MSIIFGLGYAINLLCNLKPRIILIHVNERARSDTNEKLEGIPG